MAEDRFDQIQGILKELYDKHEDVEACMVVRKGLEGVVTFPEDFIDRVSTTWQPMKDTIDILLEVVADNAMYGIDKCYVEMLDYGIVFCIISMSDTSLVTFIRKSEGSETLGKVSAELGDILEARKKIVELVEG
ncbi:MAG: hypothetical protein JW778_06715 [Candidatus Altiarchaeota archaeon]|nr:hypothetical protein [Candidatus Altiarchaeota archaeon]